MTTNTIKTVTVEKNFRTLVCGTIETIKDSHGNPRFIAERKASKDAFPFWTFGGAELWLKLDGLLRG